MRTRFLTLFVLLLLIIKAPGARAGDGIAAGYTYVLRAGQYPETIKNLKPAKVYVLVYGIFISRDRFEGIFLKGDTITDHKKFIDSSGRGLTGYRLVYENRTGIDSAIDLNTAFRTTKRYINTGNDLLKVMVYDNSSQKTDEFVFNYVAASEAKTTRGSAGAGSMTLEKLLRSYYVYTSFDRNNYALNAVWMLSVGIDNYGTVNYRTCKSDAQSYIGFFKNQYAQMNGAPASQFHEYLLLDTAATQQAITGALKDIARKSAYNDYFIFNFSGISTEIKTDGIPGTYFLPYNVIPGQHDILVENRDKQDKTDPLKNCISLRTLQEFIQAIPADKQLFISEAGPSARFKTEFIKTLMQNSPEVASILNKNRVIIVPNALGMDQVTCDDKRILKGPINYYITSLETANIYDLFQEESKASRVAFQIRNKAWECKSFSEEYFDIFFERKFLREYKEIFTDNNGETRGFTPKPAELKKTARLDGKQYALVVGTDTYKGGWKKLPNAVSDARAISDELAQDYGFDVQLLENKAIDTIYKAIGEYYRNLQPNDQLVIYFSGHGDMETEFMDDGFIVCTDSKPRDQDLTRSSYIQYVVLQKMLNKIPARQILVMLDVCHGGTFNQKRSDPVNTITNRNVRQFLVDQSQYTCRKFLSSVGAEEAFDGKPGDHSPFANLLLQVLRAKGQNSNGIVTLSSIYSVLQTASMNETATLKISPQKDGFGKDNPESEFILIPAETTVKK